MAGVGLIDEDFKPVTKFDSWLDMRCQPFIELIDKEAGDRITELTGCPPTCDHGLKMFCWKNKQPAIYERTAKFVMPGTYVAGKIANLTAGRAWSWGDAFRRIWH
jgi:xylulokinase